MPASTRPVLGHPRSTFAYTGAGRADTRARGLGPRIEAAFEELILRLAPDLRAGARRLPVDFAAACQARVHPASGVFDDPVLFSLPAHLVAGPGPASPRALDLHVLAILTDFGAWRAASRHDRRVVFGLNDLQARITDDLPWFRGAMLQASSQVERARRECRESRSVAHESDWVANARQRQALLLPTVELIATDEGWDREFARWSRTFVAEAALGMQCLVDVLDWPRQHARGGSWLLRTVGLGDCAASMSAIADELQTRGGLASGLAVAAAAFERASRSAPNRVLVDWCWRRKRKVESVAHSMLAPGGALRCVGGPPMTQGHGRP